MRISVTRFMGEPLAQAIGFDFAARGGSIGRDPASEIVLPDPDKHVSRLQARVERRGEHFFLIDEGTNPSQVNGRPLGKGAAVQLAEGDEISIAGYLLRVEFSRPPPVFGGPPGAPPAVDQPVAGVGGSIDSGRPAGGLFDELAAGDAAAGHRPSPAGDDPFAVFSVPTHDAGRNTPSPAPRGEPPSGSEQVRHDPLGRGYGAEESVDVLYGLGGGQRDPLAERSLGDGVPQQGGGGSLPLDPMAYFGGAPAVKAPAPERDNAPVLNQALELPPLQTPTPPAERRAAAPVGPGERAARAGGAGVAVCSWEDGPVVDRQARSSVDRRPEEGSLPGLAAPHAKVGPVPAAALDPETATAASGTPPELLAAFERGLGVPVNLPALTPALMEQIGRLLGEATQGTVDLLKARGKTKSEVRAQVTMVAPQGNNPLKFSPDAGFALAQLLRPRMPGFMQADEAMRDAFDDLQAHQFGFMAGMRAALSGVLNRFEPAALERRVADRRLLDSLVPASRKAKLWDLFAQMYGDISREASDDFDALFNREFVKAYEEQVARLKAKDDAH